MITINNPPKHFDLGDVIETVWQESVHLTGKIIGKSYGRTIYYDLLIANGQQVKGVDHNDTTKLVTRKTRQ